MWTSIWHSSSSCVHLPDTPFRRVTLYLGIHFTMYTSTWHFTMFTWHSSLPSVHLPDTPLHHVTSSWHSSSPSVTLPSTPLHHVCLYLTLLFLICTSTWHFDPIYNGYLYLALLFTTFTSTIHGTKVSDPVLDPDGSGAIACFGSGSGFSNFSGSRSWNKKRVQEGL